jgi:hypothetical protein
MGGVAAFKIFSERSHFWYCTHKYGKDPLGPKGMIHKEKLSRLKKGEKNVR